MMPFVAALVLFFAAAAHHGSAGLTTAFAQTPSWCGLYAGPYCATQSFCKVPGGLTGCIQWGIRAVYHPKTIQQCTVPGTTAGTDEQTDSSGECAN